MQSLHQNIEFVQHISGAKTATETPTNGVDLRDFAGGVALAIHVGPVTNIANSPQPTWTFHLEESDTINSGFAAVTNSDHVDIEGSRSPVVAPDSSTGVFLTIDDAAEDDLTYRVGYLGSKRYVRVVATAANTPGSTNIVAFVVGQPLLRPAADA
ncbi:MAG: hypothetical protein P1U65_07615 [Minwuia sp.]|nr:hypothetical protein [Minwuia sp.]